MEAKVSQAFKDTIKSYLDQMASKDEAFALSYENPKKSIDECCEYTLGQVMSRGECGFEDAEIFGMAVHYYDEEDLGEWPKPGQCQVVVNHHVELTPEEIEEAKKEAKERIANEEASKIRERQQKAQEAARKRAGEAKAQAKAEAQKEVSLFDSLFGDETED